jgi:hypothetical protein
MPPSHVAAAQQRCQAWLEAQKSASAVPRVESAIDKFERTVRPDDPPQMPAWDPALAGNQSQSVECAAERFKRLRLAGVDQSQMPPRK